MLSSSLVAPLAIILIETREIINKLQIDDVVLSRCLTGEHEPVFCNSISAISADIIQNLTKNIKTPN